MRSLHKNVKLMLEFLKAPFLVLHFPCQTFNDPPDDIICNIAIYADNTTLYSKCHLASGLWQQLELISELECDPRDTEDWDRKWFVNFNEEKSSFKMLWLTGAMALRRNGLMKQWPSG